VEGISPIKTHLVIFRAFSNTQLTGILFAFVRCIALSKPIEGKAYVFGEYYCNIRNCLDN
jgi:hypothetical protein